MGHTVTVEKVHCNDLQIYKLATQTSSTCHYWFKCRFHPAIFIAVLPPCSFLSDFDDNDLTARNLSHRLYVALLVSLPSSQKRRPIEGKTGLCSIYNLLLFFRVRDMYLVRACSYFPALYVVIHGRSFILWLSQCFVSDSFLFLIVYR